MIDTKAWHAAVHGDTKSRTRLKQLSISSSSSTASTFSNMKITLYLPSGHTLYIQQWLLQDNLYLVRAGLRRRQCDPTPVLLPGKSHGQRSLEGCSPWGCWGSDTTERLHFHFSLSCIRVGNGNPLQCSFLKNPRMGRPGRLPSMGSHSRTRLKRLSRSSSSSRNFKQTT